MVRLNAKKNTKTDQQNLLTKLGRPDFLKLPDTWQTDKLDILYIFVRNLPASEIRKHLPAQRSSAGFPSAFHCASIPVACTITNEVSLSK